MTSKYEADLLRQALDKVGAGNANSLSAEERGLLRRVYDRLQSNRELDAYEEGLTSAERWALERGYDLETHLSDEELRGDLDGTLPEAEAKMVRAHLATCAECRAEAQDILDMRQAIQRAEARRAVAKRTRYIYFKWIRNLFALLNKYARQRS